MSHKFKVQFGGAADSPIHDYSDVVRIYDKSGSPAIHGGMRFDSGGGSAGEFVLIDDDNKIPAGDADDLHLAGHNPCWWIEDTPGYDAWLSVGWIDVKDIGRFEHPYHNSRTWQGSWADANKELDGITLTAEEVRPAESGVTRMLWVFDTFYNGDPRLSTVITADSADHLVPNTATQVMPAKTYPAGTPVTDIIKDCADTEGKVYGVVIHQDADEAGDHKCLLYIDEEDHDTYASPAKISDQIADWDPTDPDAPVFEPHWLQGSASTEDPGELISGVVSTWKGGTVTVTDDTHADDYNYYVVPFNDDSSETEAQATAKATAYLHSRWNEHVTHSPSIMVAPSQHPLIRAGMSIEIKSAAAMGGQYLGTYQTRRIAEVNWEPGGMWNGEPFLWAHLQLDRPLRILATGPGAKPGPQPPSGSCTDVSSSKAPHFIDGTTTDWGVGGNTNGFSTTGGGHNGANTAGVASGLDVNCTLIYLFTGTFTAGKTYTLRYWYWSTFDNTVPVAFGAGTYALSGTPTMTDATTTSVTAVSDGVWRLHEIEWTPTANRTSVIVQWGSVSGDTGQFNVSDGSLEECTDASAPPASDDDTGDPGDTTTGCFSPCDHKHPVQTATNTPITDSGGYYTGTDVETALQELGAAGAAYTDEEAQDAVGTILTDSTTVDFTYTDATPSITASVLPAGIKLDDLGAPDDNTDLDASTSKHGLLPKLGGGTTNFLRADGSWAAPPSGGSLDLDDLTDVDTTSAAPSDGDVLTYDSGTSLWVPGTPSGGSGSGAPYLPLDAAAASSIGSGDDFSGTTLDGGWSDLQSTALTVKDASIDGFLILGNSGAIGPNVHRGIKRSFSPSGDFTVWTKLVFRRVPGAYHGTTLFIGDSDASDGASGHRAQVFIYRDGPTGSTYFEFSTWSAGSRTSVAATDIGTTGLWLPSDQFPLWIAMRRVGTAVSFGLSVDGVEWSWYGTTTTISFTVATCGLAIDSHTNGDPPRSIFDYIATT